MAIGSFFPRSSQISGSVDGLPKRDSPDLLGAGVCGAGLGSEPSAESLQGREGGHGCHHTLQANILSIFPFLVGSSLCLVLLMSQPGSFSPQSSLHPGFCLGVGEAVSWEHIGVGVGGDEEETWW